MHYTMQASFFLVILVVHFYLSKVYNIQSFLFRLAQKKRRREYYNKNSRSCKFVKFVEYGERKCMYLRVVNAIVMKYMSYSFCIETGKECFTRYQMHYGCM